MLTRCENVRAANYHLYGAQGITVASEWHRFENFLADMGERPADTTLDRIDGTGNYEPGNCRWATAKQQRRNQRPLRMLTFRGETRCCAEWADIVGLTRNTIYRRLDRLGWSVEKTLTTPIDKKKSHR